MSKKYILYEDTSNTNEIQGSCVVDETNLNDVLGNTLSGIMVDMTSTITSLNYYILNGVITLKEEVSTTIYPTAVDDTTTTSGDNTGLVVVSGIPIHSTVKVYSGLYEPGSPYMGHVYEFEEVNDGVFETTVDDCGSYTIEVVPPGIQYHNITHSVSII